MNDDFDFLQAIGGLCWTLTKLAAFSTLYYVIGRAVARGLGI
jgi:hypothetical protein